MPVFATVRTIAVWPGADADDSAVGTSVKKARATSAPIPRVVFRKGPAPEAVVSYQAILDGPCAPSSIVTICGAGRLVAGTGVPPLPPLGGVTGESRGPALPSDSRNQMCPLTWPTVT